MRWTNICLTEAAYAALGARARAAGSTRSQVLREILDSSLGLGPASDHLAEIDAALAECSDHVGRRARELVAGDPDLASA